MRWAGVQLAIEEPRAYVQHIVRALRQDGGWPASVLHEGELLAGTRSAQVHAVLGTAYTGSEALEALLVREWIRSELNEFAWLWEFLESKQLLSGVDSVHVAGAGTCRLVDALAAQPDIRRVSCSDLSWPALFLGRALMAGHRRMLPVPFRRSGVFRTIDPLDRDVRSRRVPREYEAPRRLTNRRVDYQVRNAFDGFSRLREELLCIPYLLDALPVSRYETLLIRLLQGLAIDREVLLVCTVREGSSRRLDVLLATFRACGFAVERLYLPRLPYSFNAFGSGARRDIWETAFIRARKTRAPDLRHIVIETSVDLAPHDGAAGPLHHPDGHAIAVSADIRRLLTFAARRVPLQALVRHFQLGGASLELALGMLTRAGLVKLATDEPR